MSGFADVISALGVSVRYRTALTPPSTLDFHDSGPSPLMQWLKPQVEVLSADGTVLASAAPYGPPNAPESWAAAAVLGILVLLGVGLAGYGLGKSVGG